MVADADPTAVFEQVANETRRAVLRALADAYGESPTDPWVRYSDLRKAVGTRDKGTFNYHLDRLGDLVVSGEAGYRLSRLGMAVVGAVASGNFDPDRTWGPVEVPGACRACGDALALRYEDGVLWLTCGTDGHVTPLSAAPSLLESGPDEGRVRRLAFSLNQWGELTRKGVCAECRGYVGTTLDRLPDDDHYHYHGRCRRCGFHHGLPVGRSLVCHPAVVAFHHDHGVDVRSEPPWTLPFCAPGAETVGSEDPLRLRVDVTRGDERLSLRLDGDGAVLGTERGPVDRNDP